MTQPYRRPDLSVVDEELLVRKENKKVFKKVAYGAGIGVGFFLILPILPEIGDEAKSDAIKHIFSVFAATMIFYSIALTFSFFLLRDNIKLVLLMLNWIVLPMVGLWGLMGLMDALQL